MEAAITAIGAIAVAVIANSATHQLLSRKSRNLASLDRQLDVLAKMPPQSPAYLSLEDHVRYETELLIERDCGRDSLALEHWRLLASSVYLISLGFLLILAPAFDAFGVLSPEVLSGYASATALEWGVVGLGLALFVPGGVAAEKAKDLRLRSRVLKRLRDEDAASQPATGPSDNGEPCPEETIESFGSE